MARDLSVSGVWDALRIGLQPQEARHARCQRFSRRSPSESVSDRDPRAANARDLLAWAACALVAVGLYPVLIGSAIHASGARVVAYAMAMLLATGLAMWVARSAWIGVASVAAVATVYEWDGARLDPADSEFWRIGTAFILVAGSLAVALVGTIVRWIQRRW